MDLESGSRMDSHLVGYFTEESVVRIAATPHGVLVAHQAGGDLQLQWYTDGTVDAGTRSLPQLGAKNGQTLRGLAVFDDRIVLATSPVRATKSGPTTTAWILDDKGKLLGSYPCHGGLFSPGDATFVRSADDVILANLTPNESDGVPVCAGRLHGPAALARGHPARRHARGGDDRRLLPPPRGPRAARGGPRARREPGAKGPPTAASPGPGSATRRARG